ncbi:hypothetical protein PybrP1_005624 [[Pythium] brassicae (nom. inval.)]|nr:hypothetical protein PybrP1_005624 [[Pythium] brassicae (nom. inval.)]
MNLLPTQATAPRFPARSAGRRRCPRRRRRRTRRRPARQSPRRRRRLPAMRRRPLLLRKVLELLLEPRLLRLADLRAPERGERLELPLAALAPLKLLPRVDLAHEHDVGELGLLQVPVRLARAKVRGRQVVALGAVAGLQQRAEVRAHEERRVVHAKVAYARDLDVRDDKAAVLAAVALAVALGRRLALLAHVLDRLDVEHDELDHRRARLERQERRLPVLVGRHLGALARARVHDVDHRGRARAEHERRDVATALRELLGQDEQVVAAHGAQLDAVRRLEVRRAVVHVLRHELARGLGPHRHVRRHEVDEPLGGRLGAKVKVHALLYGHDPDRVLVRLVLENDLLEAQERALVLRLLADLHERPPRVVPVLLHAVRALHAPDHKRHDARVLDDRVVEHLALQRELHLDALRVRLGPDEARVHELRLAQAVHALEAERHELRRLPVAREPRARRAARELALAARLEAQAAAALRQLGLERDALGHVRRARHARLAHVDGVRLDLHAAHAAGAKEGRERGEGGGEGMWCYATRVLVDRSVERTWPWC